MILQDIFGADLVPDVALPESALLLFRRAAPMSWLQNRVTRNHKGKSIIDAAGGRVQRLSKSLVHRLNGNFVGQRDDFGRIHP